MIHSSAASISTPGATSDDSVAVRAERLIARLAAGCARCRPGPVSACRTCVCLTARDLQATMKQSRYGLGVIDLDTGKLERRDPSASFRAAYARARSRAVRTVAPAGQIGKPADQQPNEQEVIK